MCVCLSVTTKSATYLIYTPNARYLRVLYGVLKVSVVWLLLKTAIFTIVLGCMLPTFMYANEKIITTVMMTTALPIYLVISFLLDTVCIVPNAKAAISVGVPNTSVSCYIPRNGVIRNIQDLLRSQSVDDAPLHPGGYFFIEGQLGCGKTTIVRQALTEIGPGVLYVPVGVDGDVSMSLYRSLRIDEYCAGFWAMLYTYLKLPLQVCPDNPHSCLKFALTIIILLLKAAAEIIVNKQYVPIVVFDNLSQILKQQEFNAVVAGHCEAYIR